MKKVSIFITLIMMLSAFTFPISVKAEEEKANDLSDIIESVEMLSDNKDQFDKQEIPFSEANLRIKIAYDKNKFVNPIKKGDKLEITLRPDSYDKDFITMDYSTSVLNKLMDNSKNPPVKVADIDMTSRKGVKFTFTGEAEQFKADLNLPFEAKKEAITKYFEDHPGETETTFTYTLQFDGKKQKTLEYTIKKEKPGPSVNYFGKTRGTYELKGKLGDGNFHYNIIFDTELRSPNEYVIYDLPDVNLGFDGELKIFDGAYHQGMNYRIFSNDNTDPNGKYEWSKVNDNGTKVRVYDVYYLTKEPATEKQIRIPAWKEETLQFHRGNKTVESMDTAIVPKDVLFEKPLGSKLTAEEEQKIEEKGGLYKKVGKGFKVRISDYKSKYLSEKGGHLTFIYRMNIKNPSPELNADGNPIYKNFATYYGQEIPNCKPGEKCEQIKSEKTKAKDNGSPENPTKGIVKPGTIGADVTAPETIFTKVEADENGNPLMNNPLKGAKFTIYNSDADGNKKDVAKNKDGVALENLITDENGKLTKDGNIIPLTIDKGYYIVTEISSPEGYEIIKKDTKLTVGYKATTLAIANKKNKPIESTYKAIYEFRAKKSSDILPSDVMNLLPADNTKYKDGSNVKAMQPQKTVVKTANGKWVFKGYDTNSKTINKMDVKFTGVWDYEEIIEPENPSKPSTPGITKKPTKTNKNNKNKTSQGNPSTGDSSNIFIYITLLGLTSTLLFTLKRRNYKKH